MTAIERLADLQGNLEHLEGLLAGRHVDADALREFKRRAVEELEAGG